MLLLARRLMWGALIALVALAAALWPDLPARIPTHFGIDGQPDAWAEPSVWLWFGLPALAAALVALVEGVAQTVRRRPESPFISLPYKPEILALPPGPRARALDWSAAGVYLAGAAVVVTLALVQVGIWAEAHGRGGSAWVNAGVAIGLVAPLAAAGWASLKARGVIRQSGA